MVDFYKSIEAQTNRAVNSLGEPCNVTLSQVTYPDVRCVVTHVNSSTEDDGLRRIYQETATFRFVLPDGAPDPVLGDEIVWRNNSFKVVHLNTGYGSNRQVSATHSKVTSIGNTKDKGKR